jgi:hypothetical protein
MPKGVAQQAGNNSATAQGLSSNLTGNAAGIYGGLEPTLQAEASAPGGYTPTQMADMNTAAQQSAGGSQAATAGAGGLYAARTKNAGAAQSAIGAGTRAAGANLSKAAVGNQVQNADLEQQQKQEGLKGLGGLYGTDLSGGESALGLSNSALNTEAQADENNPWMKLLQTGMSGAATAATGNLGR